MVPNLGGAPPQGGRKSSQGGAREQIYFEVGLGGSCAYNDLQRYITATSVCTLLYASTI